MTLKENKAMILSTDSPYKKAFNCFLQEAAIALEGHNPILNLPQQLNNLYTAQNLIKVLCKARQKHLSRQQPHDY
jgi:hypothetical protein